MYRPAELLAVHHEAATFDCGALPLNNYLKRVALTNNASGSARTYVVSPADSNTVVGYYSLCAS